MQDRPGLHDRFGHADALRQGRRHDDRRLSGGDPDDRRVGPDLPAVTIDTLLDRAIGPQGYYGVLRRQHAHGHRRRTTGPKRSSPRRWRVACPSSRRSSCSTGSMAATARRSAASPGTARRSAFTVASGTGSNGFEAMLPTVPGASTLTGITRLASPSTYRIETIKGVAYAMFASAAGAYQAQYGVDSTAPVISAVAPHPVGIVGHHHVDHQRGRGLAGRLRNLTERARRCRPRTPRSQPGTRWYFPDSQQHDVPLSSALGRRSTNATFSPNPPAAPATFATTAPSGTCPCTIWPATQVPAVASAQDASAVELG